MNKWIDRQAERRKDRQMDGLTSRRIERYNNIQTDTKTNRASLVSCSQLVRKLYNNNEKFIKI
jgi:hypothetical protein